MKAGVVVISWNSRGFIGACLDGLQQWEPERPLYIVDHGSADGSPEYIERAYPTATLIATPANLGFAGGNNLGIQRALADGCDAVVLLNNDTIVDEPFIEPCLEVLEKTPQVGVVGPIVVDAQAPGVIQCRGGRISQWRLDFGYLGRGEPFKREHRIEQVDYVLGAAMVIARRALEETGGFDPEFFPAYVEEADLCYRAALLGYSSVVYHGARVRHVGGKSSGGDESAFRRLTTNRLRFALKHLRGVQFLVATQVLIWRAAWKKL